MRIVFWQNCLSPHQLPYIEKLVYDERVDSVDIIAGEIVSPERKMMGWLDPVMGGENSELSRCNIYILPNEETIRCLFAKRTEDSVHLFSGIRGFKFVYNAFCISLDYTVKRGIITERPNTFAFGLANGKPLWLHKLRFMIQDRKFIPYIDYVFAIGEECADYYQSISKRWIVIPFAYCVTSSKTRLYEGTGEGTVYGEPVSMQKCRSLIKGCIKDEKETTLMLLYVGTMAWRKGISTLFYATKGSRGIRIDLAGDGPQKTKLENMAKSWPLPDVHFLGYQKNSDIPVIMSIHDALVLPSIYDGWGAVVNEALMQGLYVVCSDKCGAKDLVVNERIGKVFKSGSVEELKTCLQFVSERLVTIRKDRYYRCKWAIEHISGEAIAKYMVDRLSNKESTPPWKKS